MTKLRLGRSKKRKKRQETAVDHVRKVIQSFVDGVENEPLSPVFEFKRIKSPSQPSQSGSFNSDEAEEGPKKVPDAVRRLAAQRLHESLKKQTEDKQIILQKDAYSCINQSIVSLFAKFHWDPPEGS